MKIAAKLASAFACLLLSLNAMGGSGSGGTWAKTTLLLQSTEYDRAFLSLEGSTTIPESETGPQLPIPADEYNDFVEEYNIQITTGVPFVFSFKDGNGKTHNYSLVNGGDAGTMFLYLEAIPD